MTPRTLRTTEAQHTQQERSQKFEPQIDQTLLKGKGYASAPLC